jgi:hypothetical protein
VLRHPRVRHNHSGAVPWWRHPHFLRPARFRDLAQHHEKALERKPARHDCGEACKP